MGNIYIIGGAGNSAANVIESSLGDIREGARFVYLWTGKPTAGQARVLDWLIDYGAAFTVYSETPKVPQAVETAAASVVLVDNVVERSIADFSDVATMLVLFDTDENGEPTALTERVVLKANDAGMRVLELTNGLVPITVEDADAPEPKSPAKASGKPQDASKSDGGTQVQGKPEAALKTPVSVLCEYTMVVYSDGSVKVTPKD